MKTKVRKSHQSQNLATLSDSFSKFLDEEMQEGDHDASTLARVKDSFKRFIDEEKLEKIAPTSSQVHVPTAGSEKELEKIGKVLGHMIKNVTKHELSTEGRDHIAEHNFAIPESRSYPIHDIDHARNALSRVSQHGTPEEKARVRDAVFSKYPSLRPVAKSDGPRRVASIAVQHGKHLLMGKRRDNDKWTTPGGHLDAGESFPEGALRELLEETGIACKATQLKAVAEVNKLKDKEGKDLHVQPFAIKLKSRPQTSMMNDPDGEVYRWQWVDVSNGIPDGIAKEMHTPLERNCLMKAIGLYEENKPSDFDQSDDVYPQLDNLEVEMLSKGLDLPIEKLLEGMRKEFYRDDGGLRYEDDDSNADVGSSNAEGLMDYQRLVEGMDWELEHTTLDADTARQTAEEVLSEDPDHYAKLRQQQDSTDDVLAKDVYENEENPGPNEGLMVDLGSGQTRENGHIGLDLYPYDHGTMIHDIEMGLPFPDQSVKKLRLCNVDGLSDIKAVLSEIQRVLMPGGQFTYEGPNDIYNYPSWAQDYPGMVLTDHESNIAKENTTNISDADDESNTLHRQIFTRLAEPDAATANDAEPRIGVAALDQLPADALLAMDAMSYYNSDADSSGRGNRLHGYPSQGALFDGGPQADQGTSREVREKELRKEGDFWDGYQDDKASKRKRLKMRMVGKDQTAAGADDDNSDSRVTVTPAQQAVHEALNPVNPNPPPPQRLKRASKIEKVLKSLKTIPIMKASSSKQIVYGVVLAPNEIDAQDDYMEPADIEQAAHQYLREARIVGSGHERPIKAHPVESFIAPCDFEIHGQYGNQLVKKGSWVLGVKIDDPAEWDKVQSGEYQGFSVGGMGERVVV